LSEPNVAEREELPQKGAKNTKKELMRLPI
jgi:hypothetical protein